VITDNRLQCVQTVRYIIFYSRLEVDDMNPNDFILSKHLWNIYIMCENFGETI
jgi:hypothetical protein